MALRRFEIRNFRNIQEAQLHFNSKLNFIFGLNGAGKSSLLEAICFLGLGRSFRTRKYSQLISTDAAQFSLYGEVDQLGFPHKLGVEKTRHGSSTLKIDGKLATKAADLAHLIPLQVINSQSFALLEGGPGERRRFLDWLVFHVKHEFSDLWNTAMRCLKQRNALLRQGVGGYESLAYWDKQLVSLSNEVNRLRVEVLGDYLTHARTFTEDCPFTHGSVAATALEITFNQGWSDEVDYEVVLKKNFRRDVQLGYTSAGFHKADIRFHVAGRNIVEIYSRGQQKAIVCALLVAQLKYFYKVTQKDCLLLVDDLPAEMDLNNIRIFSGWINQLQKIQTFISGIEIGHVASQWPELKEDSYRVFHVKHGRFNEEPCEWSNP